MPIENDSQQNNLQLGKNLEEQEKFNIKVILADNDPEIREPTCAVLKSFGCTVEEVRSAEKLIERLESATPEEFGLVITDKEMDEMSGVTACQKIREKFPNLPLILYSGNLENKDIKNIETLNGVCLEKPFGIRNLKATIKKALAKFPNNPSPTS